ncbi:MAG: Uncharacterised protein [SAR116 cluster bacterium]|nr:MAG: Uncharacterised protein [SAR116 cluster bacterium]
MLVFDSPLVFFIARAVKAIAHGLVLQVTLTALVADRAVQRVIDQQEFHHPFTRLFHPVSVGANNHALASRHGA